MIDIKYNPVTPDQIEQIYSLTRSYSFLINKRAKLFKERNINPNNLSEENAKKLLDDHYTFLKRPILIYNGKIFVGNSNQVIEMAKKHINEK